MHCQPLSAPSTTASSSAKPNSSSNSHHLRTLHSSSHKISKRHSPPLPSDSSGNSSSSSSSSPPVYNIHKNDFLRVVQSLTSGGAHGTALTTPTPRLHRVRPPPLPLPPRPAGNHTAHGDGTPFSPLPPLPAVCAPAESPVSSYLRCLRGGWPSEEPTGSPLFHFPSSPRSLDLPPI